MSTTSWFFEVLILSISCIAESPWITPFITKLFRSPCHTRTCSASDGEGQDDRARAPPGEPSRLRLLPDRGGPGTQLDGLRGRARARVHGRQPRAPRPCPRDPEGAPRADLGYGGRGIRRGVPDAAHARTGARASDRGRCGEHPEPERAGRRPDGVPPPLPPDPDPSESVAPAAQGPPHRPRVRP